MHMMNTNRRSIEMTKGKIAVIIPIIVVLLHFCSGTNTPNPSYEKKDIKDHFHKIFTVEAFEKAGFEHFDGQVFQLLFKNEALYIFNKEDFLIAKYAGNKLQRVFKTNKGQAPAEMITPGSLISYDNDTIAVFDFAKMSILLFDLDLNYIKEIKTDSRFRRMDRVGVDLVAMLNYKNEDVFAILDKNFKIVNTIVRANNKIPFERFWPTLLNMGYFLEKNLVAHSYWVFPREECNVNIHKLNGDMVAMLTWEQPFIPTAKSIREGTNIYSCIYVGKYGSYFAVQNSHSKTLLGSKKHYDFLIFDQGGSLKYRGDFPYSILKTSNSPKATRIYFLDDEEGISTVDVTGFF